MNDYRVLKYRITMSSKREYLAFICKNYCPRKEMKENIKHLIHLHCRPRQSHLCFNNRLVIADIFYCSFLRVIVSQEFSLPGV